MIRDLVVWSVEKYGGTKTLADRLLIHGEKQYITWIVRSLTDKDNVNSSLLMLSELLDIPLANVRYAYFTAQSKPKTELRKRPEYPKVMSLLKEIDDIPYLWESLLKYCYRQLKRLAIEQMVERGETASAIMYDLNVSNGLVYKVRSSYIKRVLNEKSKL